MLSARIRGSQGFDWRRLKIGLSAGYSYFESPLLVQDEVLRYCGNSISVEGDVSLSPWRWLSVSYEGKYYQSASRQQGFERMPWLKTMTNKGTLNFNIPGGVSLRTSVYHYYNNFNDGDKSFLLLNVEVRYTIEAFCVHPVLRQSAEPQKLYLLQSISADRGDVDIQYPPSQHITQNQIQNTLKFTI